MTTNHFPQKRSNAYKLLKILYYCYLNKNIYPDGYILKKLLQELSKLSDIDFTFALQYLIEPTHEVDNPNKISFIEITKYPGMSIESIDTYYEFRISQQGLLKAKQTFKGKTIRKPTGKVDSGQTVNEGTKKKKNATEKDELNNEYFGAKDQDDFIKKVKAGYRNALLEAEMIYEKEKTNLKFQSEIAIIKILYDIFRHLDVYTVCHQCNVATLVKHMCYKIFPDDTGKIYLYTVAALVHDVGKFIIPDSILSRPQKTTRGQCEQIKEHPTIGRDILTFQLPFTMNFNEVGDIIFQHHYRLDGTGYPEYEEDKRIKPPRVITEGAQILAVADVYEAIVSPRPYKPPYSTEKAFEELENKGRKQYNQRYVKVCKGIVTNPKFIFPMYKRETGIPKKFPNSSQKNHFINHLYEYNPEAIDDILDIKSQMTK